MCDVTQILQQIESGDPSAADELLPLVYDELRKLAAARMAQESPNQTLQATALVHEAYIRLVDAEQVRNWNSRGHFFGAAAEAMRRILVENARRKQARRHGGGRERCEIGLSELPAADMDDNLIALNDALDLLGQEDPAACELVKLRYFAGMTVKDAAALIGVSPRKANFLWAYARAWLRRRIDA
jgi:RNA polymerase sigma factor (TIGR02999 family)